MPAIAYKRKYHIHETVGATNASESYMISDPETDCGLAAVKEIQSIFKIAAKAFLDKALLPIKLEMQSSEGTNLLEMHQPASLIKPTFTIKNNEGRTLCQLQYNSCRFKPVIEVLDERRQVMGKILSDWRLNDFIFFGINNEPIANIKHCFGGFLRETFTTADDYDVEMLAETPDPGQAMVALAAAIAIDIWFHE